jgi:hypothetical protein
MTADPGTSPSTLDRDGERQRRDWDLVRALCGIFPTRGGDHPGEDDEPTG